MDETAPSDMAGVPGGATGASELGVPHTDASPRAVARWVRLCRPASLVLTLGPLAIAVALMGASGSRVDPGMAVLMALALACAHVGANLLDAHLEYERSRQSRMGDVIAVMEATKPGDLLAYQGLTVLRAAFVLLALSVCFGIPLIVTGGTAELALGVFGLTVAFLYSATSFALKRVPGGEAVIVVALGPALVAAAVLAQRQHVTGPVVLLGGALGLFGAAVVEVVHMRDQLRPTVFGLVPPSRSDVSRWIYGVFVASPFALVIATVLTHTALLGAAASLLAFPPALLALGAGVRARSAMVLDAVARHTLGAYAWFVGLLVAGLLGGHVIQSIIR